MAEGVEIRAAFAEALDTEDWDRIEEIWLEVLDESPIPTAELFEVRRLIWKGGKKNLARTLLELLADSLEASGNREDTLSALRELTRLTDGKPSPELLERLLASFVAARKGSSSLRAVLETHPMVSARRPLEVLEAAECWLDHDVGTVVEVVGQGVGRVVDLNFQLENIKVDLGTQRPVSVPFGAVKRYLRPLPEGDFRRRKVEDPEGLAQFVASEPAESLVQVLESLSEPSGVSAIKAALEGVLPSSTWTSWWTKARKHPRILSSGSGSRLRYAVSQSAESADEVLLEELRAAAPSDRLVVARRLVDRGRDTAAAAGEILRNSLEELEGTLPGIAWQTAGILAGLPGESDAASACRQRLLESADALALLSEVSDRVSRADALEALAENRPGEWPAIWGDWFLHEESSQILLTIATKLESEGHDDVIDQALEAIFRNHSSHPAQFIWACEAMTQDDSPESVRIRMTPSLLEKLPDAYIRREFSSFRSRAKTLLDGGNVAIRVLMELANARQATRFAQRIARIDLVEPQRIRLVEQAAQHQQDEPDTHEIPILAASREAAELKREELRTLIEVDIPKTLKGINAAAAEGDLRENFEYHMLRDRQELQSARAAKLQEDLKIVRILEPGAADTSSVNIGTRVLLETATGETIAPVTILGAWDADLEQRIFANGSGIAQRILGKSVGDEVEVEEGFATITGIEAWSG